MRSQMLFHFILLISLIECLSAMGLIEITPSRWKCPGGLLDLLKPKYLCCWQKVCSCETSCPNALYCSSTEEFKVGRACSVSLKDKRESSRSIAIMIVGATMPVTIALMVMMVYCLRKSCQHCRGTGEETDRQQIIARQELEDSHELERLRRYRSQQTLFLLHIPRGPYGRASINTPTTTYLPSYDEALDKLLEEPVVSAAEEMQSNQASE